MWVVVDFHMDTVVTRHAATHVAPTPPGRLSQVGEFSLDRERQKVQTK